jgi:uncharacterized Zn-binding protein involved in type VI secretion
MSYAHKQGDLRNCGATTIVTGQTFVTIGGKLWAVQDDQDSHGAGGLIASKTFITINSKPIIVDGDNAKPDNLCFVPGGGGNHCNPKAVSPSGFVEVD